MIQSGGPGGDPDRPAARGETAASTETAEAPADQGARRANIGNIQPTSNAGRRDASAVECREPSQPWRLAFDGVTVDYGRSRVLSRVSFTCRPGSLTGIFGANGAGKTTLLRLASGRARPSRGRVVYGDGGLTEAMRGRIGWLGHDPGLYPELTAAENLRFFAALHGVADPDARVGEALDRARLSDRAGDPVGSFSRGMRQRIGLERALIAAPRVVLLDEPFTGLDEVSSQLLLARLAALRDGGAIVLLSTHDPARIEALLDAAIVLRGGRLVAHV